MKHIGNQFLFIIFGNGFKAEMRRFRCFIDRTFVRIFTRIREELLLAHIAYLIELKLRLL